MSTKYRFEELSEANQERAKAGFIDARTGDDYWYELNIDGALLSRKKTRARRYDHAYEPGAYGVCRRCGDEKHASPS